MSENCGRTGRLHRWNIEEYMFGSGRLEDYDKDYVECLACGLRLDFVVFT